MRPCKHSTPEEPVCKRCISTRAAGARWRLKHPGAARAATKRWEDANPEKRLAAVKRWRENNIEKYEARHIVTSKLWYRRNTKRVLELRRLRIFGLTAQAFEALLAKADRCCQICRTPLEQGNGGFGAAVDHCHLTNVVRGVLCGLCNKGLGFLQDDPNLLRRAIAYLEQA